MSTYVFFMINDTNRINITVLHYDNHSLLTPNKSRPIINDFFGDLGYLKFKLATEFQSCLLYTSRCV